MNRRTGRAPLSSPARWLALMAALGLLGLASGSAGAAAPTTGAPAKALSLPTRRPIVLDPLHVEGKTDAPRVLFVHAGPTVALEDAPAHPSYLRDDFTAALSSPVRVRVRTGVTPRLPSAGGNR